MSSRHRCRWCPKMLSGKRDVCWHCEQELRAEPRTLELAGGRWVSDRAGIKRWVPAP